MKLVAVCAHGLGSSMILSMNLKKAMDELNIKGDVSHCDVSSVEQVEADFFVVSTDIADTVKKENKIIVKDFLNIELLKQAIKENTNV